MISLETTAVIRLDELLAVVGLQINICRIRDCHGGSICDAVLDILEIEVGSLGHANAPHAGGDLIRLHLSAKGEHPHLRDGVVAGKAVFVCSVQARNGGAGGSVLRHDERSETQQANAQWLIVAVLKVEVEVAVLSL